MSTPFVGEIRMFGGNFPPNGWAFCDGQLLSIAENEVLFVLIGTTFGGDGQTTFALPDMRGRIPVHQGSNGQATWTMGEQRGTETVALTAAHLPPHTHQMQASTHTASTAHGPADVLGVSPQAKFYGTGTPSLAMAPNTVSNTQGTGVHANMAPTLGIQFIISLFGIFPSQS